jgi:hypothetical protein
VVVSLQDAWNEQGDNWIRWARAPGHDSYWQFHRDRFLELVPDAARLTLDVGAGEGRLARELVSAAIPSLRSTVLFASLVPAPSIRTL